MSRYRKLLLLSRHVSRDVSICYKYLIFNIIFNISVTLRFIYVLYIYVRLYDCSVSVL